MPRILPRHPLWKSLAIALAAFALYALFGFLAAPRLIQREIANYATERLERKATVGEVRVNPLRLTLELKDFALAERDGTPILGFGRLYADFEASSLVRRAWTFAEVNLEKPALRADIAPDGTVNLAELLRKLLGPEQRAAAQLPRLVVRRLALSAGTITLSDRSGATPASTALSPINLDLRELSTLPDDRGSYALSARLADGGNLSWRGEMSLQPLASRGEVRFSGMKPLTMWRFLRDELEVAEPGGEVDFSARYRAAFGKGAPQLALEEIRFAGRGIAITASGANEPILAVSSVAAEGGRFDLAARELVLPLVRVSEGAVAVVVDKGGAINWAKLVKPGWESRAPRPDAGTPGEPWKARVESLRVAGFGVRYVDGSRRKPLQIVAKDLAVDLAATVETRPDGVQVLLDRLAVTLSKPAIGDIGTKEPLAQFDSIALEGGSLDLESRSLGISRVAIKGGLLKVTRDKRGTVGLLDLATGTDVGVLRRGVATAAKEAKAEGRPWILACDSLEVAGTRVAVSDETFGEPIAYDADVLIARVGGYRSDGKAPVKVEARVRLAQGGTIETNGTLRTTGDEFTGRIKLDGVSLKPLRPALMRRVPPELVSGELSADVKVNYQARDGRHEARATGAARLDNVQVNDAPGGEHLIGWKTLFANGISLSLAPDALTVEEVRIVGVDAKVVVFKDRSVNLMKAVMVVPQAASAVAPAAAQATTVADLKPVFPATIGRVAFEQGTVDFADQSLVLPFAAKVEDLTGVIQGLSTDRASRASVRLEGRVAEYGLARAEGSLNPFRPASFLDLNVVFRNVDMPPLSPYTATFAGRRIASGRLALDLQYKIDDGKLAGENRVVLEKFTLGERVKSPGALDLPLDLAVALLTDSDGKIDLAVPVHGSVNDPQFSYGHVIWQAIVNVLTRIVTAPFRALGALFGGGGESLESIAFDPGRATLLPPEREKLKRVAEALGKRPQLRVVAEGQYGPTDRAALQRRDVELAVATRLGRAPAPGDLPDPVSVTDAKTQRALEALFVERQSEEALSKFVAETEKSRGKAVARVNAALALVGRGSADREFYEALLKRLTETAQVPDAALAQLAGARAHAVTEQLTAAFAVPAARAEARTAAAAGEARVRLALDVAPAAAQHQGDEKE